MNIFKEFVQNDSRFVEEDLPKTFHNITLNIKEYLSDDTIAADDFYNVAYPFPENDLAVWANLPRSGYGDLRRCGIIFVPMDNNKFIGIIIVDITGNPVLEFGMGIVLQLDENKILREQKLFYTNPIYGSYAWCMRNSMEKDIFDGTFVPTMQAMLYGTYRLLQTLQE